MARERQGVGVRMRGSEACGQSIDMAGEGGGRRGRGRSGWLDASSLRRVLTCFYF